MVPTRDPRLGGAFDLDKPLYTISVASEILETHPRTLMMYEDLGLIEPYRTATNRRRYSQRNVRKLQVIQQLTREKGVVGIFFRADELQNRLAQQIDSGAGFRRQPDLDDTVDGAAAGLDARQVDLVAHDHPRQRRM